MQKGRKCLGIKGLLVKYDGDAFLYEMGPAWGSTQLSARLKGKQVERDEMRGGGKVNRLEVMGEKKPFQAGGQVESALDYG